MGRSLVRSLVRTSSYYDLGRGGSKEKFIQFPGERRRRRGGGGGRPLTRSHYSSPSSDFLRKKFLMEDPSPIGGGGGGLYRGNFRVGMGNHRTLKENRPGIKDFHEKNAPLGRRIFSEEKLSNQLIKDCLRREESTHCKKTLLKLIECIHFKKEKNYVFNCRHFLRSTVTMEVLIFDTSLLAPPSVQITVLRRRMSRLRTPIQYYARCKDRCMKSLWQLSTQGRYMIRSLQRIHHHGIPS